MLFAALSHREEIQYDLDDDSAVYPADSKGRFDTPEHVCVFGDALRRIALFKGTRAAVERRGFQTYVSLIANASSADCIAALSHEGLRDAKAEVLARDDRVSNNMSSALQTCVNWC